MSDLPMLQAGELPADVVWVKGQLEAGTLGGHLHWQFCIAFRTKKSLAAVKTILGATVHAELSRSDAASAYVCKDHTRVDGPWEWGAKPVLRSSRTDWESVWTAAQRADLLAIPPSIRVVSYRTLRAIASDYLPCPPITRTVHVFWGRTETGKSRRAWDEAGLDAYSKDPRSKFWDGYQNQRFVVIDEFRGGIDVSHILRWCDRYPVRVEVKGSSRPLLAEVIWITSNLNPLDWYPDLDLETKEALIRRFNIVFFP